jgi:phage tail sheath protein FI
MPVATTYPGVYVQEIPSGVRTIAGVATSITGFVGRAVSGPICTATSTDPPPTLTSFPDYERQFGGLDVNTPMSYAVRDFYLNGGTLAIVVRVAHDDATAATITLPGDGSPAENLVLEASSVGDWGNRLDAVVDHNTDKALRRTSPPQTNPQRFNLTVRYRKQAGKDNFDTEYFSSVSTLEGDPRFLPLVLERESSYVRVRDPMPAFRPLANTTPIAADAGSGSDGTDIDDNDVLGDQDSKTGIYALNRVDLFNLLCIPPLVRDTTGLPSTWTLPSANTYQNALKLCVGRRAMLIVDPDPAWGTSINRAIENAIGGRNDLNLSGTDARNATLYFPCVREVDSLRDSRVDTFVPSGIIAGIMARTDVARGVWKAPAGLDASLSGVKDLQVNLNDLENGELNPLGINCLRSMGVNGRVVWGARTLRGADENADEYKYIPVRRLALFLEESLYRSTQWVVFEPNDEPLWAQVRLNVGAFMQGLFRQGAFQGSTPKDAYFVKCDSQTTTQNDINLGILNIIVGFAPLKPAEFVVISIQQMAGQIQT